MKKSLLKNRFDLICSEYIKKFEEKQELYFEGWVGDNIGEIATFGDVYFFNFDDIRYDIDNEIVRGLIKNWLHDSINNKYKNINYKSYAQGLMFDDIKVNYMNVIHTIVKIVCEEYLIEPKILMSKTRKREIVFPRQTCHYLAKKHTKFSLAEIGKHIGYKDHATVINSIKTVENLVETCHHSQEMIELIDKRLKNEL